MGRKDVDIETERLWQVLGWTGGEASDEPLTLTDKDGKSHTFATWMDGAPDYVGKRDLQGANAWDCITIAADVMFGDLPNVLMEPDGSYRYVRLARFMSSGETMCPCADMPEDERTADDAGLCPLCESPVTGDETRYIYIGDGMAETVYRKDESTDVD